MFLSDRPYRLVLTRHNEINLSCYLFDSLNQTEVVSVEFSPSSWSLVITISLPRSTFTTERERERESGIKMDASNIIP